MRVVGLTGRDQQYVSGGDPTQRRSGGGNKVQAGGGRKTPGGGVGGFATSAWLSGGGDGGLGGEVRREPLLVMSDRDKAVMALEVLKTLLGDEVGNLEALVRGKLPPEKTPTPPPSPTEQQFKKKRTN